MKLNNISAVIPTDNANLRPMLKNKELLVMATTVVFGGFGRRASFSLTRRSFMQAARSV